MNKDEFMTALSELSNNILGKVHEKLESLKRWLSEDQETCADQIVKKVKSQTKSVWKKKSNEVQHNFNEAVNDKVEGALSALAKNKLDKVKSELEDLPAQDSELGPVLPADFKDITEFYFHFYITLLIYVLEVYFL